MSPRNAQREPLFQRQDAGPWTCPACGVVHPYQRFSVDQRVKMLMAFKVGFYGGDLEYEDGALKCMLCLAVRGRVPREAPE